MLFQCVVCCLFISLIIKRSLSSQRKQQVFLFLVRLLFLFSVFFYLLLIWKSWALLLQPGKWIRVCLFLTGRSPSWLDCHLIDDQKSKRWKSGAYPRRITYSPGCWPMPLVFFFLFSSIFFPELKRTRRERRRRRKKWPSRTSYSLCFVVEENEQQQPLVRWCICRTVRPPAWGRSSKEMLQSNVGGRAVTEHRRQLILFFFFRC